MGFPSLTEWGAAHNEPRRCIETGVSDPRVTVGRLIRRPEPYGQAATTNDRDGYAFVCSNRL